MTISILNKEALAEARSLAAGAIHTLTLARMHGRDIEAAQKTVESCITTLANAEFTIEHELRLVGDSVKMLVALRDAACK